MLVATWVMWGCGVYKEWIMGCESLDYQLVLSQECKIRVSSGAVNQIHTSTGA